MRLPEGLANWLRARRRAGQRRAAEHQRVMAKVDMSPRFGRRVRVPPPPGGWRNGRGKRAGSGRPRYHGKPVPPPRD
ncbi:MAG TPA: hypothetical protein VMU95_39250 [Trebonia sp.]|nr:hypothetical protein [Trebonia sp.]